MRRRFRREILTVSGLLALVMPAWAAPVVRLGTSLPSPQRLGTTIVLNATANDTDPGVISYKFEIGTSSGSVLNTVRDFSVANTFTYSPTAFEGSYLFQVTARNNSTLNTATATISPYLFTRIATGSSPVVTATANPLVALFSAPPCPLGNLVRVNFQRNGAPNPAYTVWRKCNPLVTTNILIAGMVAHTTYSMHSETWNGSAVQAGPVVTFQTGTPAVAFPAVTVPVPLTALDSQTERMLLISDQTSFPFAVDLAGEPIWYYNDPSLTVAPLVTRMVAGGTILLLAQGPNSQSAAAPGQQVVREIDLAGNVLRETNASRIEEQLISGFGLESSCQAGSTDCMMGVLHHEALRLPNGHTLVMGDEEKVYTDGTQGSSPSNPIDIVGDIIVDLDANFQVTWYWRAFDHLDVNRAAVLGETCKAPGGAGGCPTLFVFLAPVANDWLHSNALNYLPSEGSIVMSLRHQDWIIKIDYQNGAGTGNVLWTLGLDGDFRMTSRDPYPWFSHQHDPGFELNGTTMLSMFDNGNTRVANNPGLTEHSRGYVLSVDQNNMNVTPIVLDDLGVYSPSLGSAQRLANGDFHFLAGNLNNGAPYNESLELFPNKVTGFNLQVAGGTAYRSFRVANLDTPPVK